MAWSWTPVRRDEPEMMDSPGLPVAEVADAYHVLQQVNRQFFGSRRSLGRELDRLLDEDRAGAQHLSALDVGSGSGDLAHALRDRARARGVALSALTLDRDPTALALATRLGLPAVRGDALRLPCADRSIDLVTAVKFAHHFAGGSLALLLGEMTRVARRRVIVLDIRRHWLAYWGFMAWSRAFTRNRLVRYDGPLSVLRGFTRAELAALAAPVHTFSWAVRGYAGFQLALVGRRIDATKGGTSALP